MRGASVRRGPPALPRTWSAHHVRVRPGLLVAFPPNPRGALPCAADPQLYVPPLANRHRRALLESWTSLGYSGRWSDPNRRDLIHPASLMMTIFFLCLLGFLLYTVRTWLDQGALLMHSHWRLHAAATLLLKSGVVTKLKVASSRG